MSQNGFIDLEKINREQDIRRFTRISKQLYERSLSYIRTLRVLEAKFRYSPDKKLFFERIRGYLAERGQSFDEWETNALRNYIRRKYLNMKARLIYDMRDEEFIYFLNRELEFFNKIYRNAEFKKLLDEKLKGRDITQILNQMVRDLEDMNFFKKKYDTTVNRKQEEKKKM